jgi:hypothetical protein
VDELQIKNAPGFRLGVFAEFPISKRWAVSPKTELSFNYGRVIINDVGYRVDPVNLDLCYTLSTNLSGKKVARCSLS